MCSATCGFSISSATMSKTTWVRFPYLVYYFARRRRRGGGAARFQARKVHLPMIGASGAIAGVSRALTFVALPESESADVCSSFSFFIRFIEIPRIFYLGILVSYAGRQRRGFSHFQRWPRRRHRRRRVVGADLSLRRGLC